MLKGSRSRKLNALLLVGSLAFCFLAIEVFIRSSPHTAFKLANPDFYSDRNWFEFHPSLGYTLRRNHSTAYAYLYDDCQERRVPIITNSIGIRDTIPQNLGDKPLCAFIGDSFTEGYNVESSQTYPALVKKAFAGRLYVVNFGIHNYGCEDYRKMAMFVKKRYHPVHLYIGLFIGNDLAFYRHNIAKIFDSYLSASLYSYSWVKIGFRPILNFRCRSHGQNPAGLNDHSDLLQNHSEFFDDFKNCDQEKIRSYMEEYLLYRTQPSVTRLYGEQKEIAEIVRSTVQVLKDIQGHLGDCKLHVLIFPERIQVKDAEWKWLAGRFSEYKNRRLNIDLLMAELERERIAFTNYLPLLDEKCYLRFDGHFSEQGHQKIAEIIVGQLAQEAPDREHE